MQDLSSRNEDLLILSLSDRAVAALFKAKTLVAQSGQNQFSFLDVLKHSSNGKTSLYAAFRELRSESLVIYTPARYGNPAIYRLSDEFLGGCLPADNNPVVHTTTTTTKNTINDKLPANRNTESTGDREAGGGEYQYTGLDMMEISAICRRHNLSEGFVLSLLTERMRRFAETAPAFELLTQRILYSQAKCPRSLEAYVRTVFLMRDFNDTGQREQWERQNYQQQVPDGLPETTADQKLSPDDPEVWRSVLRLMEGRINTPSFNTWLRPCKYQGFDPTGNAVIVVPDETFAYWLGEHYVPLLSTTFREVVGQECGIVCTVHRGVQAKEDTQGQIASASRLSCDSRKTAQVAGTALSKQDARRLYHDIKARAIEQQQGKQDGLAKLPY